MARLRARHCARSLLGGGAACALPTRARAAPRWRHSLHAPWKGAAQARSRPSLVQGRAPMCPLWPALRGVACACSALARHCTRSLLGRGAACALPTRARAALRWRHSLHALWKGTARARSRPSSMQDNALTCQPWPSLGEVACVCSALARHCVQSLLGGGAACSLATRARAAVTDGTRSMRHERALHKRETALLRREAMIPRASSGPHLVRWLARVARLRATALALCWEEAQHAPLLCKRAAPRWRH